jgi:hypothetical protein
MEILEQHHLLTNIQISSPCPEATSAPCESILLIFHDENIIIFVLCFCNSETYFYIISLSTVMTSTPLSIKRSSQSTESILTRSDSEQLPLKRRCLAYETECNPILLERYAFCMIRIDFHFDEIVLNVLLFMWGLVQCFIAFNLTASLCLVILCIYGSCQ